MTSKRIRQNFCFICIRRRQTRKKYLIDIYIYIDDYPFDAATNKLCRSQITYFIIFTLCNNDTFIHVCIYIYIHKSRYIYMLFIFGLCILCGTEFLFFLFFLYLYIYIYIYIYVDTLFGTFTFH